MPDTPKQVNGCQMFKVDQITLGKPGNSY